MNIKLETNHLVMLPANDARDGDAFLKMLTEDGDFRTYSGVEFSKENLLKFKNYFCKDGISPFALFLKQNMCLHFADKKISIKKAGNENPALSTRRKISKQMGVHTNAWKEQIS